MPKAGSSSIQKNCYSLREFLLRHGINYLNLSQNHSLNVGSLLADIPHHYSFNAMRGIDTPEKAATYNLQIREDFESALRTNTSPKFIISAEALSETSPAGLRKLKKLLAPYASSTRIICYVRHPADFMSSALQQKVKAGLSTMTDRPMPRYRERLEPFLALFGKENVGIRILDTAYLVNSDLISDFLTAIDESPHLLDGQKIVKVNESLSHEAVLIGDSLNKILPGLANGKRNPERTSVQKWLCQIKGEKFVLDPQLDEETGSALKDDLNWLHNALGREVFFWEPRGPSQAHWSAETVESVAIMLHDMATLIAKQKRALRRVKQVRKSTREPS